MKAAAATPHPAHSDDGHGGVSEPSTRHSAESLGIYALPTMPHTHVLNDTYSRWSDDHGTAAGAAGIGTAGGAAAMQRARSRRNGDAAANPAFGAGGGPGEETPYITFPRLSPRPQKIYDQQGVPRLRNRSMQGLSVTPPAFIYRRLSDRTELLLDNKSHHNLWPASPRYSSSSPPHDQLHPMSSSGTLPFSQDLDEAYADDARGAELASSDEGAAGHFIGHMTSVKE